MTWVVFELQPMRKEFRLNGLPGGDASMAVVAGHDASVLATRMAGESATEYNLE
jgi:hypothetical protein